MEYGKGVRAFPVKTARNKLPYIDISLLYVTMCHRHSKASYRSGPFDRIYVLRAIIDQVLETLSTAVY